MVLARHSMDRRPPGDLHGLPHEPRGPMSLLSVSTLHSSGLLAHFASSSNAASFAEGGVTVDLDASFVVQLVLFVVLLVVLKPLLFDPMLRLFEEREKRIDHAIKEASD